MTKHANRTLELALEPRMMFDAAAVATAADVAQDVQAQQDQATPIAETRAGEGVDATGTGNTVQIGPDGGASDVDIFRDVTVTGDSFGKLTLTVSGVGAGSGLVFGDQRINLEHGAQLVLSNEATVSVSEVNGNYEVVIDVFGMDSSSIENLVDNMRLSVDGTTQTESSVTVTLDSISDENNVVTELGKESVLSVTTQYNHKPQIDATDELSIADQLVIAGIGTATQIATSSDGTIAFVMDDAGKVSVFELVDGELTQKATFDTSTIEGFGSAKVIATGGDGSHIFVINNSHMVYSLSYENGSLSYTGFSISTGSDMDNMEKVVVTEDGKYAVITNMKYVTLYSIGADGSLTKGNALDTGLNYLNQFTINGKYIFGNYQGFPYPYKGVYLFEIVEDGNEAKLELIGKKVDYSTAVDSAVLVDGSLAFLLTGDGIHSFYPENGVLSEGIKTSVSGAVNIALSADGKSLYALTNDGTLISYSVGETGALTETGRTAGLTGGKVVSVTDDGSVVVSGEKTYLLTTDKQGTWGSSIDFTSGLTLSDLELDKGNNYGGAVVTVTSSSTSGSYRFTSDGYELSNNYIVKNGQQLASVTTANGRLVINYMTGCSTQDAQAILHGWSYLTGSGSSSDSSSVTLSVTLSDGNKVSDTHEITVYLGDNQPPSVSHTGGDNQVFDTAGQEISIFGNVSVDAGEFGQNIEEVIVNVSGLDNLGESEYIVVDSTKILLGQTSQGKTAGGFTYTYIVNSNGTAVLTIDFGDGANVQTVSNLLSDFVYGNEGVAGQTVDGLRGDRVFTISSVKDTGGTANGGIDTVNPEITTTIELELNSAPNIEIEGGQTPDAFISGSLVEGSAGFTGDIVVSDDGRTVISVGYSSQSLTGAATLYVYSRDPATGSMKLLETFTQSGTTDGLNQISSVAFSPDGNYVWVAGNSGDSDVYSLVLFSRNSDGILQYVGKVATQDEQQGDKTIDGLNGWVSEIVVSADGQTLYTINGTNAIGGVSSQQDLSVFTIDKSTGKLTYVQTITENIFNPSAIKISSDGLTVYVGNKAVTSERQDAQISVFTRNPDTGELTYSNSIDVGFDHEANNLGNYRGVDDLVVSKDGNFIYAVTSFSSRNGWRAIQVIEKTSEGYRVVDTIQVAAFYSETASLQLSNDGKYLYQGGNQQRAVDIYSIGDDGKLTLSQTVNSTGVTQDVYLYYQQSDVMVVTPDGKNILWGGALQVTGIVSASAQVTVFDVGSGANVGEHITITDIDNDTSGNYSGTSVTFERQGGADENDTFLFKSSDAVEFNNGRITYNGNEVGRYTNESGKLAISFTASTVSAEAMRSVLQQVVYKSAVSTVLSRLSVTVNDGNKETTAVLAIKAADIALDGQSEHSAYNADGVVLFPNKEISFSGTLKPNSVKVVVTTTDTGADFSVGVNSGYSFAGGNITTSGGETIGSYTTTSGQLTLTFTGAATPANVNGVLQALTYSTSSSAAVSFDLQIQDANGNTLIEQKDAATVYANQPPVWNGGDSYSLEVYPGENVTIVLSKDLFTDPEGSQLTYTLEGLPNGLTFNADTLTITGTAAVGTHQLTITVTDSNGATATQTFDLHISTDANQPPVFNESSPLTNLSKDAGEAFNQDISSLFTEPNDDSMSFSAEGLPEGMTLSSEGILTGTPDLSGTYTVKITATDAHGATTTGEITLTIVNDAPRVNDGAVFPAPVAKENFNLELNSLFTEPDGQSMTFEVSGLPEGLTFADGKVTGMPLESGTFTVTVKATDQYGASTLQEFTFTIDNEAPQFNADEYSDYVINVGEHNMQIGEDGIKLPEDLFVDDFGVEGWAVTDITNTDGEAVDGGLAGLGLSFDQETGTFTGKPNVQGDFNITIEAIDASGEKTSHTFTLTIEANKPPVVSENIASPHFVFNDTTENTNRNSVTLTNWIQDPSGETLTYELTGDLPAGLTWNADSQTISGIAQQAGTFELTLSASDGTNEPVTYTFKLTVRDNTAPQHNGALPTDRFVVGGNYSIDLNDYIKDADGDELSFTVQGLPAGMSFDPATGVIYGTPSETGTSSITIRAVDPYNLASTFEIDVTVVENATPTQTESVAFGNAEGAFAADLHQMFADPEGDALTFELVDATQLPEGFTFDAATGVISGSSPTETTFNVDVLVKDQYGAAVTRTVTVMIRVNTVSFADAGVWTPADGQGLHLLRDDADIDDYQTVRLTATLLGTDGPVMEPVYGVTSPVAAEVSDIGQLNTSEALLRVFERTIEDADTQKQADEARRERAVETQVDKHDIKAPALVEAPESAESATTAIDNFAGLAMSETVIDEALLLTESTAQERDTSLNKAIERRALYRESEFTTKASV